MKFENPLPADPHPLSEHRFVLAELLARYRVHCVLGGLCVALGSVLLALDFTDAESLSVWAGVLIGMGLPFFIPTLLTYLRSIQYVRVYEEGIAWRSRKGEEFHAWDEVREVFRAEKSTRFSGRQSELTLVLKKTGAVQFDQRLSDFFSLATLLEAIVTERLLPSYRAALDQGGASFGPIRLKRDGIRVHDREFAWSEVEQCALCNGGLVVTPFRYDDYTGEFASFSSIPNYLILLKLLEELGQRPVAAEQSILLGGRKRSGDSHA